MKRITRQELLQRKESLTRCLQGMTIPRPSDGGIDQPFCPFCGKPQEPMKYQFPSTFTDGETHYSACGCTEMQAYIKALKDLKVIEDELADTEDELCRYSEHAREVWEQSNVGPRYMTAAFQDFDWGEDTPAMEACKYFAHNFDRADGRGLLLYGTPGNGKTHLAAATARHIVYDLGYSAKFFPYGELLDRLRMARRDDAQVAEFIIALTSIDLMILDDLGHENDTGWAQEKFFTIIDARYRAKKSTIITSNLTRPQMASRIDPAVLSRLIGTYQWIELKGPDYRQEIKR